MTNHHGNIIASHKGRDVMECEDCGFKHLYPIPTGIREYYLRSFYQKDKPNYYEREQEDLEWLTQIVYPIQFDLIQGKTLLDVGCGYGTFLREAKLRNFECFGIEPSEQVGQAGIIPSFIEDVDFPNQVFDVIRAAWVLEHLENPRKVVEKLVGALNPGGYLLVIVPNDFSPMQLALKREPYWVACPHINYFDIASIKRLLEGAGLTVTDTLATFPIECYQFQGFDYVGHDEIGQYIHGLRKGWELKLGHRLMAQMQRGYAAAGVGRDVIMVGRK